MPHDWTGTAGPTRFVSRELEPGRRDTLVEVLTDAHAREPFSPSDPRAGVRRATSVVEAVGLSVVTIRGTVAVAGVEVDHVWLAVTDDTGEPWVLDPAFPLHLPSFVALLGGYVAGDLTIEDLAAAAAGAGLDDRVLGRVPVGAWYRGEPVWGLVRTLDERRPVAGG